VTKKKDKITSPFDPTKAATESAPELDAIIQIAEERQGYLTNMRAALLAGDNAQVTYWACRLCGLDPNNLEGKSSAKKTKAE
jgi:hypothetical protein